MRENAPVLPCPSKGGRECVGRPYTGEPRRLGEATRLTQIFSSTRFPPRFNRFRKKEAYSTAREEDRGFNEYPRGTTTAPRRLATCSVVTCLSLNCPRQYRSTKDVLPTHPSPSRTTLNSLFSAMIPRFPDETRTLEQNHSQICSCGSSSPSTDHTDVTSSSGVNEQLTSKETPSLVEWPQNEMHLSSAR